MVLKSPERLTLGIWVEYPITTGYDKDAKIRETIRSFFIYWPTNNAGGFVEFNVDLERWTLIQDPNLPQASNAKVIALSKMGYQHMLRGFPLDEPGVNPKFYDWRGSPLD